MLHVTLFAYFQNDYDAGCDSLCFISPCSAPGTGWAGYSFDPVSGPEQVFSNFFGTSNPYEALNGGQSFSSIML